MDINLILSEQNKKSIEVDATESDHRPVHAFQVYKEEFGEDCNNNYI